MQPFFIGMAVFLFGVGILSSMLMNCATRDNMVETARKWFYASIISFVFSGIHVALGLGG